MDVRIKKIIAEYLGLNEDLVVPDATFFDDLGADSLNFIEMIMSLEEEFDLEISDEDAEKCETVQDVFDLIARLTA